MVNAIIVVVFFGTLIVIFWVWLSVVLWTLKNGISPMPTSQKIQRKVLGSVPPETQGKVIDLGSGWGNMVVQFAKLLPQCQVIGYETSPIPFLFSKLWRRLSGLHNIQLSRKDIIKASIADAALVYCYLYPGAMKELQQKFDNELKPGTIVISNMFALPDWEPVQVLQVQDMYHTRVYIYMKSNSNVEALHAKPREDRDAKISPLG